jgi:hypothetical protein
MRKRSKYKPKPVLPDPLNWVLSGFKPLRDMNEATTLRIKNHDALLQITQGTGGRAQIDILIAAMNMAEAFYRVNPMLGLEYADEIREAQDAIVAMSRRGLAKGSFLFTGLELQAMNTGMDVHDAQLDACNVGELDKALALVHAEIKNKKARAITA